MLLLLIFQFSGIQQNHYSNSDSVSKITHIELHGDSLYRAWEYVARANYKEGNIKRAREILDTEIIPFSDSINFDFYRYSVSLLNALIAQNEGHYEIAVYVYQTTEIPDKYPSLNYNKYLNWASVNLVLLDHESRKAHLELAKKYAIESGDTRSKDKVVRALARYYMYNPSRARDVLKEHTPLQDITNEETLMGFLYTTGLILREERKFEESMKVLAQAKSISERAGFPLYMDEISIAHGLSWQVMQDNGPVKYYLFFALLIASWFLLVFLFKPKLTR